MNQNAERIEQLCKQLRQVLPLDYHCIAQIDYSQKPANYHTSKCDIAHVRNLNYISNESKDGKNDHINSQVGARSYVSNYENGLIQLSTSHEL